MVNVVRLPRTSRDLFVFARIAASIVSRDKREARAAVRAGAMREARRALRPRRIARGVAARV